MPSIAGIKEIFKYTPINQAIMLQGIHGIGKSEIIKQIFEKDGYIVTTLFLGQNDVGDIIGLPDRTEVEFRYNGKTVRQKITEFCPPKWWPRQDDAKMVILMDEFNRGKPEVYQCVFDMVLNRKLNNLCLPKETRIIAAINPSGDNYNYDVIDLDPALLDRFNVYDFKPTADEWVDYAIESKHNKYVIGFIIKNKQHLDPPPRHNNSSGSVVSNADLNVSMTSILPSRRSWTRVSDIMNATKGIEKIQDGKLLQDMLMGIVGTSVAVMFMQYIRESSHNISGAKVVTGWSEELKQTIRLFDHAEIVSLNKEVSIYIDENEAVLLDCGSKEASKYCDNVTKYLNTIAIELRANFVDLLTTAQNANKTWPRKLMNANGKAITTISVDVINGKSDHDKKVAEMISEQKDSEESAYKEDFNKESSDIKDNDDDDFGDISSEIDDLTK